MTKKTKEETKKAKKVFDEFVKLYDVADAFENDGRNKDAREMKKILNKVGSFIVEQM